MPIVKVDKVKKCLSLKKIRLTEPEYSEAQENVNRFDFFLVIFSFPKNRDPFCGCIKI